MVLDIERLICRMSLSYSVPWSESRVFDPRIHQFVLVNRFVTMLSVPRMARVPTKPLVPRS